jgi:hypothetical protein
MMGCWGAIRNTCPYSPKCVEKINSSKFAVSRSPAVLLSGTPRAAHGFLLEPEGSVFVTHGARMRYERLRLATPRHFLLGQPFRGFMHSPKFTMYLILPDGCGNAWETILL